MNDSEQELISRVMRGDQQAMRRIYSLYAGYLMAVCSRYVANMEDVRDILQDAFIKIFSHLDTYKPKNDASLKSWMTRIVVNDALKFLKKHNRFDFIESVDSYPDIADDDIDHAGITYEETLQMISRLPVGYRTVFNLYVFERKSHKEIAQMLDIKEDTSASQFHKAKKMLGAMIKQYKKCAI